MALAPFSLPDLSSGNAVPDYRLSDARSFFALLSFTPDVTFIINEPIGWDVAEWTIERDKQFHGLNFEFNGSEATLKFQQPEAVVFIENEYAKDGPDALIHLSWYLEDSTGTLPLQTLKLNLSKRILKGGELSVPAEQLSIHPDIRTRWDTTVSMSETKSLVTDASGVPLPVTPPGPAQLVLHAQRIKQQTILPKLPAPFDTDWRSFDNQGTSILQGGGISDIGGGVKVYRQFALTFPFEPTKAAPNEVKTFAGSLAAISTDSPETVSAFLLKTDANGGYTFKLSLDFTVDARLQRAAISLSPPDIVSYQLSVYLVTGKKKTLIGQTLTGTPVSRFMGAVRFLKDDTYSEELPRNTPVYLYAVLVLIPNRNNWKGTDVRLRVDNCSLEITASTTAPASTCPAYPVIDVLRHLTNVLTGRTNALQSAYYSFAGDNQPVDGGGSHRLETNGFALRGFVEKPLQTSLQSQLTSLQAIDAVGMAYKPTPDGDVLVVEPIAYWYRSTNMLELDSYTVIEDSTDSSYLHPSVNIGYSKFPDSGPQVLDDFNTKQEYTLPTKNGTPYTAISDLIASGYAIEQTRRVQFSDKPKDSTGYDDDGFIICASQTFRLTPEISLLSVPLTFQMVSGVAAMAFDLDKKPIWLAKGVTFLVAGTTLNNGTFMVVNYFDSFLFGVSKAIVLLDRQIAGEFAPDASLSVAASGSFQAERNESFSVVEGLIDPPTTYNLRLAPHFNLLRHSRYIAGGLVYRSGSDPVRCSFTKNNTVLRTQLASNAPGDNNIDIRGLIQHNSDFFVGGLNYPLPPLWKPETISVSTKLTIDQMLYLRACLTGTHPDSDLHYGYIQLNREGGYVRIFPLSIQFKPATGEAILTGLKKFVSLAELQGQRGCSFYSEYVFDGFETANPGAIDNWVEQCTFDNFQ